ncbi:unnamed protein product [Caenorhabditis brenneri]
MNRRTLCILLVLVACFSIVPAKEYKDLLKDSNEEGNGGAKNAAQTASFATVASIKEESGEEKKPDGSATPAKGAPSTGSFFTIGALTMASVYIV